MCMCTGCIQCPWGGVRRWHQIPQNWSVTWLWVTGQVLELSQDPLEEQQEILTTETSCWPHQISDIFKTYGSLKRMLLVHKACRAVF